MSILIKDQVHEIVYTDLLQIIVAGLSWNRFSNKTILITGANGFLPAYMVYTLLLLNDNKNLNIKILGLVRNEEKAKIKFGALLNRGDFKLLVQDVKEPVVLDQPIHFCIHAASQASPKYYKIDPVGTINANVLGTNNLLNLAKEKNMESFLFVSSGEVYGQVQEENVPTKENQYGYINILDVRSCYGEGKRLAETMCVAWFQQFGVPAKTIRPFHTYGPGLEMNDGRVYADFVSDIVEGRNIVMKSDGSARRAFCYIADATLGFFTVLLSGENGNAYNVGNSKADYSIMELAEVLCSLFPEKNLKVIRDETVTGNYMKSPIARNCPDTSALEQLGWNSWTTIEKGFYNTIKFTNEITRDKVKV